MSKKKAHHARKQQYSLRCMQSELNAWKKHAKRAGFHELADWIRGTLNMVVKVNEATGAGNAEGAEAK